MVGTIVDNERDALSRDIELQAKRERERVRLRDYRSWQHRNMN